MDVQAANAYIEQFSLHADDWLNAEEAQQQRYLNVAEQVIKRKYPRFTIPDEAVYEFSAALAVAFGDTNRLARQGVQSFALQGTVSYTFSMNEIGNVGEDLSKYIPKIAVELIAQANGIASMQRKIGRSVI